MLYTKIWCTRLDFSPDIFCKKMWYIHCTYIFGSGLPTEKVYQRKRFTNGKGLPTEKVYQPKRFTNPFIFNEEKM